MDAVAALTIGGRARTVLDPSSSPIVAGIASAAAVVRPGELGSPFVMAPMAGDEAGAKE